jgi:hypothetical protein
LDIGKDDGDVEATCEDIDSFVGITRFHSVETGRPHHVDCVHANKELVLNH